LQDKEKEKVQEFKNEVKLKSNCLPVEKDTSKTDPFGLCRLKESNPFSKSPFDTQDNSNSNSNKLPVDPKPNSLLFNRTDPLTNPPNVNNNSNKSLFKVSEANAENGGNISELNPFSNSRNKNFMNNTFGLVENKSFKQADVDKEKQSNSNR